MSLWKRKPSITVTREIVIRNELGLHARPAAQFVRKANAFRAEVWIVRDGERFSGASLIDVLRANVECGATILLEAHGPDAESAIDALEKTLVEFIDED